MEIVFRVVPRYGRIGCILFPFFCRVQKVPKWPWCVKNDQIYQIISMVASSLDVVVVVATSFNLYGEMSSKSADYSQIIPNKSV